MKYLRELDEHLKQKIAAKNKRLEEMAEAEEKALREQLKAQRQKIFNQFKRESEILLKPNLIEEHKQQIADFSTRYDQDIKQLKEENQQLQIQINKLKEKIKML